MPQDFNRKISIIVRNDLPHWQVLNTVAHVSAYFGNKVGVGFGTGEFFITKDGVQYPRNTQYAIVVLSAKPEQMADCMKEVRGSGMESMAFIREMIDATDDTEIQTILSAKEDKDVEYLGIGIFGDKDEIKILTKKFSLWK
ncbi:MAG: hypothetical protein A3B23_01995 [Candidatus Colwellbacteria bacterium RIFCSPLOWO2_01_FULL_48_10]|uniref:DUF2000 domain-containing protein n=2 Tax=Bacteria candidate phyla TaxID=1783234 RepID=A0A1F5P280_9BACT|nr:MAG: hypothetical protein A2846_04365 [Candidatus Doudnabacteria bacterium RIFCSPHIGHO2_01_FULL_49_9]OGY59110.1 MAG: hypothetical protein A3B23_01995 [Candidatus Colwellbacteria bacterium RIFCSPLOWO2_01_FULL_48_10]